MNSMTLRCNTRVLIVLTAFLGLAAPHLSAAERSNINITGYVIDAQIDPAEHTLKATARVTFTATDTVNSAIFELHNSLKVDNVVDDQRHQLSGERGPNATISVALPSPLSKGANATLTFVYEGTLSGSEESPVEGLKVASIGDPITYLLYAARWFPMVGYMTDRFTAEIHITIPAGYRVIGSGSTGTPKSVSGGQQYSFNWTKPSFPGTIIAGIFQEYKSDEAGMDLHVFFKPTHEKLAPEYTTTAVQEFTYFITLYGTPLSQRLSVVELPADTVPYAWAPEIAGLAGPSITEKTNYRLLANAIAHQWWGVSVSPATKDDWWLVDGFSRYSEAMYVENAAGGAGLEEAVKDMSVGALAYDTVPLSSASKLDPFSTEFQSLVTDKGAMILHMLRWVLGEDKYNKTMREFAEKYAAKSATMDEFRAIAEKYYGDQLTWFFSQWLDSTGAPEFKVKYTTYRLGGSAKEQSPKEDKAPGFRVVGEISQDLDLFRMPVELRIDTDGKTEEKKLEVVGTNSAFSVETFGRPRRISVDPDHHVLTNSSDVKLRSSILRGMAMQQQGDLSGALAEFNKALDINKNSSFAHYRIAEVFFQQRNYQSSANSYRASINGDGEPRWTEVWSHLQLGKIFDITGQRERAINEYRQAIQTNDDTFAALEEARKYLAKAYERPKS